MNLDVLSTVSTTTFALPCSQFQKTRVFKPKFTSPSQINFAFVSRCAKNGDLLVVEAPLPHGFDVDTMTELTRDSNVWEIPLSDFFGQGETLHFEHELSPKSERFPSSGTFDAQNLTIGSIAVILDQYGNK